MAWAYEIGVSLMTKTAQQIAMSGTGSEHEIDEGSREIDQEPRLTKAQERLTRIPDLTKDRERLTMSSSDQSFEVES
jgi:hypothetical protein